jgi:hypothetical protein
MNLIQNQTRRYISGILLEDSHLIHTEKAIIITPEKMEKFHYLSHTMKNKNLINE